MKPKKKDNWLPCDRYEFKVIDDPKLIELLDNDPFFLKKEEEARRKLANAVFPKERTIFFYDHHIKR